MGKWSGSSNGVRADLRKECRRRKLGMFCAENRIPKCQVRGRRMERIVRVRGLARVEAVRGWLGGNLGGCLHKDGTITSSCLQQMSMSFVRIMSCCYVE